MFKLILLMLIACNSAYADDPLALSTQLTVPVKYITNARDVQIKLLYNAELDNSDLWQRLRSGFSMQDMDSPLIAKQEQWYADHPAYVSRMMARANRYLYYITAEVERRGMPGEIALLPMIESGFNPEAYSTGHASGIWQFIPSTGKHFGLQQNWWYDGRRDIVGATTSALDYLEKLHRMFGEWELALAAYNWGEGSIQRAQERNRKKGLPVEYASLDLPDETRNYLPKLLAIKNVVSDPAHFGLNLPVISNEPYFTAIYTDKNIDVKLAAQLANISREEFLALNPAHNRPVILQDNSDVILLPVDKAETFQTNLENYDKPLVSWQAYHAKKGERLDQLAPRFGLSVEKLKKVNSLSADSRLSTGITLLVPLNADSAESSSEFEAFNMHLHPDVNKKQQNDLAGLKHTVRRGETLAGIAQHYHVSIAQLKQWNAPMQRISAGQTLTISQNQPVTAKISSAKPAHRLTQIPQHSIAQHSVAKHTSKVAHQPHKIRLAKEGR